MNSVKSRLYQGVKKLILSVAFILPILTGTTVFAGTNFQCDFVDIQYDYEQGVIYIDFVARVESYYSCGFLGLETCFSQDAMDRGTMYYYDAAGNRRLLFDIDLSISAKLSHPKRNKISQSYRSKVGHFASKISR